jgi:hypothetical protein
MRRLILVGSFLILLAAVFLVWQNRYERLPDFKPVSLSDLRSSQPLPAGVEWVERDHDLVIRLKPGAVAHLVLPGMTGVNLLHVRYQGSASGLETGKMPWEDGRAMIEWHQPVGSSSEKDSICSASGNYRGDVAEWVMRPDFPPAAPALRLDHLGSAGTFEFSHFEAIVVRETWIWKIGRWILMAAAVAWAVAWIGGKGKAAFGRSLLAAIVWLLMGLYCVIPGPWRSLRPLCTPFYLGEEIKKVVQPPAPRSTPPATAVQPTKPAPPADAASRSNIPPPAPAAAEKPVASAPVGQVPDRGDFILRVRQVAKKVRSLLHVALLFGPTFLIAWLVGRWPAASLGGILAVATEAAEYCFGYGFDWKDCGDLICDAAGIVLAIWACQWLKRRVAVFFAARKIRAAES